MAFQPPSNARQEQGKKILEDLHIKKQLLLKQGAVAALQQPPSTALTYGGEGHTIPASQRAHLQLANSQSFGSFVAQDSFFGNTLLPVLPRIADTPK